MNWNDIAQWLKRHTCHQHQSGEVCGHIACRQADDAIEHAERLANGKHGDVDVIGKYILQKLCRQSQSTGDCTHKGCKRAEALLEWIARQSVRSAA